MSSEEKSDDKSDDDFDSLCKEFEDDNTDNVTVVENQAQDALKDETIAEIDSFLEESIDLRTGILSSTVCESSTPIRSSFLPSTSSDVSGLRARRISSGNSDLWSTIDKQTDRAVSSAGSEESRPIESNANESANRSIILAGNLDACREQKNEDELAKEKLEEERKKEERRKTDEERKRLDEEKLDLSLLEKEQWEEDYEVTGFSVTDIMNEMDELDLTLIYEPDIESDEEEDKDSSEGDITVVAVINNKEEEKAKEKEKTKKERRANTTAIKDSKAWREELMKSKKQNKIKQKYYERAVSEWKKFTQGTNFSIPEIYEVNEPRIYKDKNGDIVGFDMPDEFIDNNHPVWQEHRDLYHQVMRGERGDEEFAKYIHTKWGWSNKIDMTRNLTHFPCVRDVPMNGGMSRGLSGKGRGEKKKEKNVDTTVTTLTNQQTINEMLAIVDEVGEVEEGEERLKTWRQIQENIQKSEANQTPDVADSKRNQTPDLADSNRNNIPDLSNSKTNDVKILEDLPCGYCRKYCMCSPGHKKVTGYVKKRKRFRSASVDKCNEENGAGAKIRKVDYMDEVSAAASRRSGGMERTAGILGSVGEVFTFNQMYHQGNDNEPWLSEEQARELNSLEDMYDIFKSHYSSPYAKDNRNSKPKQKTEVDAEKSETWDDLLEDI